MDNLSTMEIAQHPTNHKRTKYLRLQHLQIREHVADGEVILEAVATENNIADTFTKSLSFEKFNNFNKLIGLPNIILKKIKNKRLRLVGEYED